MNKQLSRTYDEDILDRKNKISDEELNKKDRLRIYLVQDILAEEKNLEAQDYHRAALIFQHGETAEHFRKAHNLAVKAVELGDNSARWLAAASLDRSLLTVGKSQKYGTQFKLNKDHQWELVKPIDPSVTDEERARWNIPPLKDALKVYMQKYGL